MLDRTVIFWTIAAFAWVTPVAAQAPAPTTMAFDGTYAGVSRTSEGAINGSTNSYHCERLNGQTGPLTIAGGVPRFNGLTTFEGSVNAQGVLVMRNPDGERLDAQIDGRGTITGRITGSCSYRMVWQKEGVK
jgi:hypothetical protein